MPIDLQSTPRGIVVCAVLATTRETIEQALEPLSRQLGPVAQTGEPYDFDYTSYYEAEMGTPLTKQLVRFEDAAPLYQLGRIKTETMALERSLAQEEGGQIRRRANIDPGLVSVEGLVLATTKYSGHRICIGPGLYAETTLLFTKRGDCAPLPWTYPDYRRADVQAFLLEARGAAFEQRR